MIENLLSILVSLVQVAAACGFGRAALALLGDFGLGEISGSENNEEKSAERSLLTELFGFGLGLLILGITMAFLAFAKGLRPVPLVLLLLGGLILLGQSLIKNPTSKHILAAIRSCARSPRFWFFVPFILMLLSESLLPDASGDAYLYHISAPRFYVLEKGFAPQPYEFTYHYPLLMEMLYTPPIAFGLEQAAILLNFWIALASCLTLYASGSLLINRTGGWIAAMLYLLAPSVILWNPTAQPETGGTFFLLLLVLALCAWNSSSQPRAVFLAGLMAGAFVGTKLLYATLVVPLTLLLFMPSFLKPRLSRSLLAPFIFAGGATLAYGVWLIKNWVYTGDPFFPLMADLFDVSSPLAEEAIRVGLLHGFPTLHGFSDWFISAFAGQLALFQTGDMGFLVGIVCVPILLIRALYLRRGLFLWGSMAVLWLVVSHYGGILQTRWFLPVYSLFTLATASIVVEVGNRLSSRLRGVFALLLLALLVINWGLGYKDRLTSYLPYHLPWTSLFANSRRDYLNTLPMYEAAEFINRSAPADAKILVMQAPPYAQVRWYRVRFIQNGHRWFYSLVKDGLASDEVAARLRAEGVTHIVTSDGPGDAPLEDFRKKECSKLGDASGYALWKLAAPKPN